MAEKDLDRKASFDHVEEIDQDLKEVEAQKTKQHGDAVLDIIGDERVVVTQEDNDRIRRKTDKQILTILIWVYLLQILDKLVMGYGNVFGLSEDNHLVDNQYSVAVTMNNIAQLAWQPFSTYLIVRVPARVLMPCFLFGWGTAQACMAASSSGLDVIRIGLKINSDKIASWQLIFIVVGSITVLTAPVVYWRIDSDIAHARFLSPEDKAKAIERLRANQTGTGTNEFKWAHVWELAYDPKTYLFGGLALCLNFGATVTTSFGPTLIKNMGYDKFITALLNMPFGALQFLTIMAASYATHKFKLKGPVLAAFMTPVLVGLAMLYHANRQPVVNQKVSLAGYYLMAFLFGGNPIIVSWMVANTAGQTKNGAILAAYNAFNATGSIIGPLLFNSKDKPRYLPGLRATLGVFAAMLGLIGLCMGLIFILNKQRERQRVAVGKPAKIKDTSMLTKYEAYGHEGGVGENALKDMTDFRNNEFVYLY
ncbi:hypothetical protein L486_04605 [Kwoniella mangroviensis CBS 10435]|uniref:Major facilitator superfamily (MFS) profile domain-containing protein n=1 Tax=Kwoniella mangroviensis CBS 10435 TaxID=1331196 RepID=A0A1B9IP33_9TREE|nr:hypothetical protein L486_04605 [Kwoniella mangroviensis CBS 10435]